MGCPKEEVMASEHTVNNRRIRDHLANCLHPVLFKEKYSFIVMFLRIFAKSTDRPITNGAVTHVTSARNKPFESKDRANFIMSNCGFRLLVATIMPTVNITLTKRKTITITHENPRVGQKPQGVGFGSSGFVEFVLIFWTSKTLILNSPSESLPVLCHISSSTVPKTHRFSQAPACLWPYP